MINLIKAYAVIYLLCACWGIVYDVLHREYLCVILDAIVAAALMQQMVRYIKKSLNRTRADIFVPFIASVFYSVTVTLAFVENRNLFTMFEHIIVILIAFLCFSPAILISTHYLVKTSRES